MDNYVFGRNNVFELLKEGKTGICVGINGEELTYMDIIEANNLPRKNPIKLMEQFKYFI